MEQILIKDISKKLDLNPKTIRFYEDSGVIPKPARNKSNYRIYSTDDIKRLSFVKKARTLGFSIEEIKELLKIREEGKYPCKKVISLLEMKVGELEEKIKFMTQFKSNLVQTLEKFKDHFEEGEKGEVCGLIENLFED